MIKYWRCFFLSQLLWLLPACTAPSFSELLAAADTIGNDAGFSRQAIDGGQFSLVSYQKIQSDSQELTVYIEGDGKSLITRTRVSLNPTPHNPLGLKLAAADTVNDNVIYLGRPCHFIATGADPECNPKYWTRYGYSADVVASLSTALDQLKADHGFTRINLVGFSGGGALVMLLAAKRDDITTIRTVAGNLDVAAFTQYHKVSPMSGSLNPADFTDKVQAIPQRHFIGSEDYVVPPQIGHSYLSQAEKTACISLRVIEGATHLSGWLQSWPEYLREPVVCKQRP
ncbi:alpha/beta fold hydrolase [Oceanicoccus sagamiensis]|uniref:alpha/beta fold hydrolase n=1 Tax=Oceanicoccus sagamiensis TaxID=716816 RepID=UPI000A26E079|nr:hypothetical protein [Oceanicoccus sagamiensis]